MIEDFALLFHMIATKIVFGEIGTGFLGSLYAPSLTSESIVALDYIVNNTSFCYSEACGCEVPL